MFDIIIIADKNPSAGNEDAPEDVTSQLCGNAYVDNDFEPADNNIISVLGQKVLIISLFVCITFILQIELTDRFIANYERWLRREVFQAHIDWDSVIVNNSYAGSATIP
jgi:hypothetical protein